MTTRIRARSVLFSLIAALALLAAGCARTVAGTPSGATPGLTSPVSVSRQELSIAGMSGSSTITAEIDGTVHGSVDKLPFRRALNAADRTRLSSLLADPRLPEEMDRTRGMCTDMPIVSISYDGREALRSDCPSTPIRETDPALSAVVDLLSTYVRR